MTNETMNTTAGDAVQKKATIPTIRSTEQYWKWKAGIRAITSILGAAAIGCAAWVLATPTKFNTNPYIGYFDFNDSVIGAVTALSISILWCLIWIFVPFLLRPIRPLHPGIAVGFDLLLWLGFIVAALFGTVGLFSLADFSSQTSHLADPAPSQSGEYSGDYYLAPNDTWIYNITNTNFNTKHWNSTTRRFEDDGFVPDRVVRDCTHYFMNCADLDAFLNQIWHGRSKRLILETVIVIVEWLGVVSHFTLFVWACVDTHRYNRKGNTTEGVTARSVAVETDQQDPAMAQHQNSANDHPAAISITHLPSDSITGQQSNIMTASTHDNDSNGLTSS